jgi:hypothetical protein
MSCAMAEHSRDKHTGWWWVEVLDHGQSHICERRMRKDQHTIWKKIQRNSQIVSLIWSRHTEMLHTSWGHAQRLWHCQLEIEYTYGTVTYKLRRPQILWNCQWYWGCRWNSHLHSVHMISQCLCKCKCHIHPTELLIISHQIQVVGTHKLRVMDVFQDFVNIPHASHNLWLTS